MTTAGNILVLRKYNGWTSTILLVLAVLFVVDGLAGQIGKKFNSFEAVAGETVLMAEAMPPNAETIEDLRATSSAEGLGLTFDSLYTGYWMGGARWNGRLVVSRDLAAGEYTVAVHNRADAPVPLLVFTVRVYADEQDMRQSSWSLSRRLGVNPFILAGALALAGIVFMGVGYLFSSRLETLLAASGQSEIFMVKRDPDDNGRQIIAFNLGRDFGLAPGDRVAVRSQQGGVVAQAEVVTVNPTDSLATVPVSAKVKPGFIVGTPPAAS